MARKVASANSFEIVGKEWIERLRADGAAPRTIAKQEWLLGLAISICKRPVAEIMPAEVYEELKRIERSGRLETARRARSTYSRVFQHAIITARAIHDPAASLMRSTVAPAVRHHAALFEPKEV